MITPKIETIVFPYLDPSFLEIFKIFYCEIALALAIFAALLFLASRLNQISTFMEQKKISISLAKFFSFFLIILGCLKTPALSLFFIPDGTVANHYFILTSYTCFLESLLTLSGGFLLYFSIRLIQINLTQHLMEYPILFAFSI